MKVPNTPPGHDPDPGAISLLRREAGLQQQQLAARAGISPAHLCMIEKGKGRPSPATVAALARVLRVDCRDLMRKAPGTRLAVVCDQCRAEWSAGHSCAAGQAA